MIRVLARAPSDSSTARCLRLHNMKTEVPILSTSFSKDARAEPKCKELLLSATFASYYTASKSAVLGRWLAEVCGKPWPHIRGMQGRQRPLKLRVGLG